MPVVVTGADAGPGRAVLDALLARGGGELRAVVAGRAAQRDLVPLGVRTALLDLSSVPEDDVVDDLVDVLAAVLTGAHTVVHAAGDEPADTLPVVTRACGAAGVVRLLVLTAREVPGAVAPGPDAVAQVLRADERA